MTRIAKAVSSVLRKKVRNILFWRLFERRAAKRFDGGATIPEDYDASSRERRQIFFYAPA